jgi:hypothetical protein
MAIAYQVLTHLVLDFIFMIHFQSVAFQGERFYDKPSHTTEK